MRAVPSRVLCSARWVPSWASAPGWPGLLEPSPSHSCCLCDPQLGAEGPPPGPRELFATNCSEAGSSQHPDTTYVPVLRPRSGQTLGKDQGPQGLRQTRASGHQGAPQAQQRTPWPPSGSSIYQEWKSFPWPIAFPLAMALAPTVHASATRQGGTRAFGPRGPRRQWKDFWGLALGWGAGGSRCPHQRPPALWLRGLRVAGTEVEGQGERLRSSAVGEPPLPTAQARAPGSLPPVPCCPCWPCSRSGEDLVLKQSADG